MKRIGIALGLVALSASSMTVQAQPPRARDDRPRAAHTQPDRRGAIRARLEARRAELSRSLEQVQRALRLLDEGAPPEQIRSAIRQAEHGRDQAPDRPAARGKRSPGGKRGPGARRHDDHDEPAFARADRPTDELGPDERQAAMEFLREHNPEMAQRLTRAMRENPEEAERALGRILPRLMPRVRELRELRERDPELFEFRIREMADGRDVMAATRRVGEARRSGEGEEEAIAHLREALAGQFEHRLEMKRHEIATLERRMGELREQLERQQDEREQWIQNELRQRLDRVDRFTGDRRPRDDQ